MPTLHRPAARALVAALVAGVLAVTGLAAPASAAAPRPVPTVVPGAKQIAMTWKATPGARRYVVEYSTASSFAKARTKRVTVSGASAVVRSLATKKKYYVRVRASTTGWGAVRATTTTTNAPGYKTGVTVRPAGTDKVRVTWPRYKAATTLRVVASWANEHVYAGSRTYAGSVDTARSWTVAVNPARTSVVLTVPSRWRSVLGSRAGHPVFVHLYATNGAKASHSLTAFGYPTPPKLSGTARDEVTFASWNVLSTTASASFPGRTWADRADAVEAGIRYAAADVLAVQEAAASARGGRQYQELAARLTGTYRPAVPVEQLAAAPTPTSGTAGESRSDHLLYRPERVSVVRSGVQSTRALIPGTPWDPSRYDRAFEWALLRSTATGTRFYVASVHLEQGHSATIVRMRRDAAAAVRSFLARRAAADGLPDAPVVVLGDLNSSVQAYPTGPQADFAAAGYVNATATTRAVRREDTTANTRSAATDHGFPTKPYRYTYTGSHIDYILVRHAGGVVAYRNQMILTATGAFDERYRGSDHNLQWARIRIR